MNPSDCTSHILNMGREMNCWREPIVDTNKDKAITCENLGHCRHGRNLVTQTEATAVNIYNHRQFFR